jgi:magnesium-protoporphyrin IX monomethyl ester (oxidative) cyclase
MREKILLVYPLQGGSGAFVRHIPLGLLYTSAELVKHNEKVEVYDCRLNPKGWAKELQSKIDSETLLVGVSVLSGTPVAQASKIGSIVKSIDSEVKVVWGGPHATFNPESVLENEKTCDFVVSGYGNESFYDLVQSIKNTTDPIDVPGIVFRQKDGDITSNKKDGTFENIPYQDIPYQLLDNYNVYGHVGHNNRIFSMYSVLGCPYQCTFCSSPAQYREIPGKKWITLDVKEVVDHVEHVVNNYQANFIYFIDDDSFVNLKHVEGIIDEINKRKLNVQLGFRGARINEIKKMSDEFLVKLVAAGTNIIHVGAESGSNRILKLIKKNCTADDIIECNRKLARHSKMKTLYNFMMGSPTETFDELNATRELMVAIVRDHPNSIIGTPNRFRPLKNTELYDLAVEHNYIPPETASEWAEHEVEHASPLPWVDKKMKKLMDLMLIGSYFVDRKATKVASGDTVIEKCVRLIDRIYGPIGRWRMRTGNTAFFFELPIYRAINFALKHVTPSFASEKPTLDIR